MNLNPTRTATLLVLMTIGLWSSRLIVNCAAYSPGTREVLDSYPVVVEDGKESFLILNDEEVANNEEILLHLSNASKEEVEEVIDSNPAIQDAILKRIREAVELRTSKKKLKAPKDPLLKKPVKTAIVVSPELGDSEDEGDADDEDGDGEDEAPHKPMDENKIKLWQAKLKNKATKIFKIGRGFKDKLLAFSRKKADKKAKKQSKKSKSSSSDNNNNNHRRWPHFHYSISSN